MSDKLKIYACSGLGENESGTYQYWLDNTKTVSNTQAANKLIALINLKYVQATRQTGLTPIQRSELLDEVDILCVCLYYANDYKGKPDSLHHAGEVIGAMVEKGMFKFNSVNSKERDEHLDELLDKMESLMSEDMNAPKDFIQWWKTEIEDSEKVGMSVEEQEKITNALETAKPVGTTDKTIFDDPDIGKYMSDAGTYFLYTYFTKEQLEDIQSIFKDNKIYRIMWHQMSDSKFSLHYPKSNNYITYICNKFNILKCTIKRSLPTVL